MTCSDKAVAKFARDGERLAKVEIHVVNQYDEVRTMNDTLIVS